MLKPIWKYGPLISEIIIINNSIYNQRTRDPQTRYLFEKKLKANSSDTWTTAEQGIQLVRRGGYAFHTDGAIAYPIIAKMFKPNELCDLNVINLRSESTLTICLRKHSPFLEMFRIKYYL